MTKSKERRNNCNKDIYKDYLKYNRDFVEHFNKKHEKSILAIKWLNSVTLNNKVYLKSNLINYYEKIGAKFIEKLKNGESLYYIDLN